MTLFLILLAVVMVGAFLHFSKRKEADPSPVILEKVISERNIGGLGKMTVTDTLIDLNVVRGINVKKIIKDIGVPKTLEDKLIVDDPTGFIFFARSLYASIRYDEIIPQYVSEEDYSRRRRWEQAYSYGIALRGNEIPTLEILKTLRLRSELNPLSGKNFHRIKEAVEYLSQLPDIDKRLDQLYPRKNFFKMKPIIFDMDYLESQWEIISKT